MLKNLSRLEFKNYWRNVDKNIFFGFLILFILGLFFSFSSTSSLAGERLNKDNYFFFTKHLTFSLSAILVMILIYVFPLFLLLPSIYIYVMNTMINIRLGKKDSKLTIGFLLKIFHFLRFKLFNFEKRPSIRY